MSKDFHEYSYKAMDPQLPLNPSPRPGAKHPKPPPSPKNPAKPPPSTTATIIKDKKLMGAYVPPPPASSDGKHHSGGGGGGEVSLPVVSLSPPDMEDGHDGYTDGTSVKHSYVNWQDLDEDEDPPHYAALHLHRKGTKTSSTNYLQLKNVDYKVQELNSHFMASVVKKDYSSVQNDLKKNPELLTQSDLSGVSALEKAVQCGDLNMLDMFISSCTSFMEHDVLIHAILYAIRENNVPMVKHLLGKQDKLLGVEDKSSRESVQSSDDEHGGLASSTGSGDSNLRFSMVGMTLTKLHKGKKKTTIPNGKGTWAQRQDREVPGFEDAEFSAYITPIVLAAKLERQEIIQLLIQTDNCEIHPLTVPCPFDKVDDCEMCTASASLKARRSVEESMRLLEIYRALASPAFIFYTTDDPVLEAFKISKEMDHMQKEDPAFKNEYHLINIQTQKFACELLHLCRTSLEIKTLLAEEKEVNEVNTMGHMASYPRILVALYYEQKDFIAHPHCQQILQQVWYSGLPKWVCGSSRFSSASVVYFILWLFMWPFLCIGFMLKVSPKLIEFMKSPMNRFISDTISFFLFISFLIANVLASDNTIDTQGQGFYTVEYLIILWVFSMTCRLMKMGYRHRYTLCSSKVFLRISDIEWRWFDTLMLLAFWIWIILRIIIIIISYVKDERHIPRSMWSGNNVFLFSDAFYAIGVILSFVRLNSLFKASNSLGPMQISLKKMVSDILRFLGIFFIVMTAFVVAVTKIYASYEGSTRLDVEGNVVKEQKDDFISFQKTYKNLFWSLFGYPDVLIGGQIVVNNTVYNSTDPEVIRHRYTEFFGLALIALYHCIAAIVMLNMLIAMMANSYNTIERNADTEWKFARTRLRMMYHNEVGSLPPPFNITIVGSIIKGIQKCCGRCSQCCQEWEWQPTHKVKKCNYKLLILRLYKRYWNQRHNKRLKQEEEIHFLIEQLKSHAFPSLSTADLNKLNQTQTSL